MGGRRSPAAPDAGRFRRALEVFRRNKGAMRTAEAMRSGVHPETLYAMRDSGLLERLGWGVYRVAEDPPLAQPDLVTVALRIPRGVVCLVSALAFHDLTTQVPHEVQIALEPGATGPRLEHPPLRVFRFTGKALTEGVQVHGIDGVPVRVYTPEKTLADCFKFRNRLGADTALEALKLYAERRKVQVGELMRFAEICRVARVMKPYLEMLL